MHLLSLSVLTKSMIKNKTSWERKTEKVYESIRPENESLIPIISSFLEQNICISLFVFANGLWIAYLMMCKIMSFYWKIDDQCKGEPIKILFEE